MCMLVYYYGGVYADYVSIYVYCMYVCMYVCMDGWMYVCVLMYYAAIYSDYVSNIYTCMYVYYAYTLLAEAKADDAEQKRLDLLGN